MFKLIDEFRKDITNEQLGRLVNMYCDEIQNKKVEETEDEVVKLLFKIYFKTAANKYKLMCRQNSLNAKGHGRPRKENKD